jgi:hypothetical protein
MHTLAEGLTELVRLVADTFRLWWRNLLPLATWFMVGYVGFRVATQGAVWLRAHQHTSLAVALFSLGVLLQLVVVVGMIRTCANSLYRWRDAAAGPGETTDPTQQRLLELLAVTLLPLIAVWSAWGFLDQRIHSFASDYQAAEGTQEQAFELGGDQWHSYLPAIVILLVLRRVLEAVDDRWSSRPIRFAQIWAEAFFALLLVVVTPPAFRAAKNWFTDRSFWYYTTTWWEDVREWFSGINIPIPDGLEFLWGVFTESLWPLFKDGIGEPLTWLAITTVVFGHRALSAGGLLRGTRLEARIGGHTAPTDRRRVAALTSKAPNLVLGGLREKFYPTLNAFRLLVGVGPVFLGVVCLVFSMYELTSGWFYVLVTNAIGDHGQHWGVMWSTVTSFARDLVFEPLRIALLAAAFDQCISVGFGRRSSSPEPSADRQPEPVRA